MHRGRDGPEELRELLNGLDGFDGNGRRVIADLSDTDDHARAEHFDHLRRLDRFVFRNRALLALLEARAVQLELDGDLGVVPSAAEEFAVSHQ